MSRIDRFKQHIFPAIVAGQPEKTSHTTLLKIMLNVGATTLLVIFAGNLLGRNVPASIYVLNILGICVILALRFWLNKGYVRQIGIVLLVISYAFITISNAALGTIRTPTATAYLLLVVIGGILFDHKGTLITVVLSSLAIAGLIIAQNASLLPQPNLTVGVTQWTSFTVFFVVAGTLINYALHSIQNALAEAEKELTLRRQAEEALRKRENFLRAITDNVPDMISLVSLDGTLQYANSSYQRCLGYGAKEVVGQSGFSFIHPEDLPYLQEQLTVALELGTTDDLLTFRGRHADGQYIWLEARAEFVQSQEGINGIVTVFRDVTMQRQTEEKIRLLSRVVEDSPVSIVIATDDGSITYVNSKFTESAGYSFDEVLGQNPRILQSGKTPAQIYTSLWQTIGAGHVWSGEFLNKRKDGSFFWESAVISPITDARGRITHFAAIKEDITDRKQMEIALRNSNAELQVRNEELNAFAHTVAHDLKNPVASIIGLSDFLVTSYDCLPKAQIQETLAAIGSSGGKANNIIEALLLLSSVREQEMKLETIAMQGVLEEVLFRLADTITATDATIAIDGMERWPLVLGYEPWVEEIWMNYVSNGLKYGRSPIRLTFAAACQANGHVRFSVRDNGFGLTPEEQSSLFAPFERLNRVDASGHGLGLSIVKRIADKLGGQVGVESEVGVGSEYYFTLPGVCANSE
ncbi:MAG: PAS domain S-box protein [Chloroflexi bacterium]|nr:PAS domain S-box protein [Chloroflexota bacterium]MBP7041161.1 PAS domain S-box protein [Chloroflexota bacterium]